MMQMVFDIYEYCDFSSIEWMFIPWACTYHLTFESIWYVLLPLFLCLMLVTVYLKIKATFHCTGIIAQVLLQIYCIGFDPHIGACVVPWRIWEKAGLSSSPPFECLKSKPPLTRSPCKSKTNCSQGQSSSKVPPKSILHSREIVRHTKQSSNPRKRNEYRR